MGGGGVGMEGRGRRVATEMGPNQPAHILGSKKLRGRSGGTPLGLGSDLRKGHSLDVHCEQTGPGAHGASRAVQTDHL